MPGLSASKVSVTVCFGGTTTTSRSAPLIEVREPIAQSEHSQHGRVRCQAYAGVSPFHSAECRERDLRTLCDNSGWQPPPLSGITHVSPQLAQDAAYLEREEW